MSTRREGYLLIDNLYSPGVTAEMVHASGKAAPAVGADTIWESATVTCCHCGAVVILNPDRKRPRGYCAKCDAYHCDNPACGNECRPFDKFLDVMQATFAKHTHYFIGGVCATCGELEVLANAATNPLEWKPNTLTVAAR